MTTPTNWPNPERPGWPLFPERDGWHVLRAFGCVTIEWWSADAQAFDNYYDPEYTVYEHACLTPEQIAEMLAAERERCAKVCARLKTEVSEVYGIGLSTTASARIVRAYVTAEKAIRNLGAAP